MDEGRNLKSATLDITLKVFFIMVSLAYVPSMIMSLGTGRWVIATVNTFAYIWVIAITLLKKVPFGFKVFSLIGIAFTVGTVVLFMAGGEGAGYIWLMFGILLSFLMGERLISSISMALATVLLAGYAAMSRAGIAPSPQPPLAVFIIGINLIAVSAILGSMIRSILLRLEKANAELTGYQAHLEKLVEDRTRDLASARDAAEQANRAKSSFLANMSHEIRTPLNAVIGFAYLLRKDPLSTRQAAWLGKMEDASRHLLQIIGDILDLSKIEADKLEIEHVDFDLHEVLTDIGNMFRDRAADKGLYLELDMEEVPLVVNGDKVRFRQILINLVGNAMKFTEKGGIKLRGSRIKSAHSPFDLRFEVVDTGIGIPPEAMGRLFSVFEQAEQSTTRTFGGTGLGLAICKRLAELMGGSIGAESVQDKGSTFFVELPFMPPAGGTDQGGSIQPPESPVT